MDSILRSEAAVAHSLGKKSVIIFSRECKARPGYQIIFSADNRTLGRGPVERGELSGADN
jgi:hypothetical protein